MKFLEKLGLVVFSIIVLIISLVVGILIAGFIEPNVIGEIILNILSDKIGGPVTLGVSVVLSILALHCIFFNSYSSERGKEGILLENENGKLLVSKDTIENLTNSVIKNFESVENSTTRVEVDTENAITIFITLSVFSDAIIKDLTVKIQSNIKDTIKKSLDLDIKEVNVRVKSISTKKENIVKE